MECQRGAAPSRGGKKYKTFFPFRCPPSKAEIELSMTCPPGEPVSPEIILEAAVDVWIQCHQVVVIASNSFFRAKRCACPASLQLLAQRLHSDLFAKMTKVIKGLTARLQEVPADRDRPTARVQRLK